MGGTERHGQRGFTPSGARRADGLHDLQLTDRAPPSWPHRRGDVQTLEVTDTNIVHDAGETGSPSPLALPALPPLPRRVWDQITTHCRASVQPSPNCSPLGAARKAELSRNIAVASGALCMQGLMRDSELADAQCSLMFVVRSDGYEVGKIAQGWNALIVSLPCHRHLT